MNITADTALPLMYAAKKYLLTGLVKECQTVLEKDLSIDTVCTVLEQSMSLHENELKNKCLSYVSKNAFCVFKTECFLRLSCDALQEIVCLDSLAHVSERQVYEFCVKWARHQLQEMGNECPSDKEIRGKLSNVLYNIRFPTMTQKDFAELTAQSTVLTSEERLGVYDYMTLGKKLETLKFVDERRRMGENVVSRFNNVNSAWNCTGPTDAISIQTTVDIYLTGVGLYGGKEASTHDVTVTVSNDRETLSTTVTKMTSDGRQEPIKIELENPVDIHANTKYTVAAVLRGPVTWYGTAGDATCYYSECGSIAFSKCEVSPNGTDVKHGQIPQLFYCLKLQ